MSATRYAPTAMVASVDHLASAAGVALLRAGGTAVDAAVGANAVLAVTAPHLCGMGGDLFALVHEPGRGRPVALNASGRAGSGADPEDLRREGHTVMPFTGDVRSVTVPGCVDGWLALHERFGRLPLADVLAPAVAYAADGFPASPLLAAGVPALRGVEGTEDFFAGGRLGEGELVRRPGLAMCLEAIVLHGRSAFYQGPFGEALVELGRGLFRAGDLARVQAEWVDPLGTRVWGHDVWTVPPNSQGYLTLLGAALGEGLDLPRDPADPGWAHLLVEAARVAGHDRRAVLHERADVSALLGELEVRRRRAVIRADARAEVVAGGGRTGDTMHLVVVDAERMGVSLTQSNASGFGSLLFIPGLGIGLHNRGIGFSLERGHPAELAPGRRPPHTLAPALVTAPDGPLRLVAGTMGGDSQPQILLQLLCRLLHHGQAPGPAVSAPRWVLAGARPTGFDTWADGADVGVVVEQGPGSEAWPEGLRNRGHPVEVAAYGSGFGHAQVIDVAPGRLAGAADPRALAGAAAGY